MKEYINLLNSICMGISLLTISDFKCQSMTHAYYIRVNILITSVLALLYLYIVVTVTEVVCDYQLQVTLMSCMLLIP